LVQATRLETGVAVTATAAYILPGLPSLDTRLLRAGAWGLTTPSYVRVPT
jgi:hypothetical protein